MIEINKYYHESINSATSKEEIEKELQKKSTVLLQKIINEYETEDCDLIKMKYEFLKEKAYFPLIRLITLDDFYVAVFRVEHRDLGFSIKRKKTRNYWESLDRN